MIVVKNLSKSYESDIDHKSVISDVTIDFPKTGLCFFLGKSGSGKSTLLNLLGGIISDYSGEILVNQNDISNFTEKDWDNYRNKYYGVIYQDFNLVETESVFYNLMLPLDIINEEKKEKDGRVDEILTYVGLLEYKYQKVNRLSGGQKQRVAIARALIKHPAIILADEPTGNLDNAASKRVFMLLKDISKQCLVIIASHDQLAAYEYGDVVYEICDGKVTNANSLSFDYLYSLKCNNKTISSGSFTTNQIVCHVTDIINKKILHDKSENFELQLDIRKAKDHKNNDFQNETQTDQGRPSNEACALSAKNAFKYALQSTKNKCTRNGFIVLLVTIVIVFQLFAMNLLYYDSALVLKKYYEEYTPLFLTLNKNYSYMDSFLNYQEAALSSGTPFYSSLTHVFDEEDVWPVINNVSIHDEHFSDDNIKIIISNPNTWDNNLLLTGRYPESCDEIVITDYLLKRLGRTPDNYYDSILNLYGKKMRVVGILQTDYVEYDIINKIATSSVNEYSEYKVHNQYLISIVSPDFIQSIKDKAMTIPVLAGNLLYAQWESRLINSDMVYGNIELMSENELLCGSFPEKENEIVISESLAMGMGIDTLAFSPIEGEFLNIHSASYANIYSDKINMSELFPEGYKIVGVFNSIISELNEHPMILLCSDLFEKLKIEYYDTYIFGEYYIISNNIALETFKLMKEEGIKWTDVSAKKVYKFAEILDKLDFYFIFASVLLFIGLVVACVLLISYSIKDQSKILGIMRTIGYTKTDLNKIFFLESVVVGVVSMLTSTLLFIMTTDLVNYRYANELIESPFNLLVFKLLYTCALLIICVIVFVLSSILPILKLSQRKPFDLIHGN